MEPRKRCSTGSLITDYFGVSNKRGGWYKRGGYYIGLFGHYLKNRVLFDKIFLKKIPNK